MQDLTPPVARFQRFERVSIATRCMGDEFVGQRGTIFGRDPHWFDRHTASRKEWIDCVSLPDLERFCSFWESDLEPTGEFDTEQSQLGSRYEISYDIVMSDDMGCVEGCYRLPGHLWQVLLFDHKDVPAVSHSFGTWRSGVTGVEFDVPNGTPINHELVVRAMSEVFGASSWTVVNSPDSLVLK